MRIKLLSGMNPPTFTRTKLENASQEGGLKAESADFDLKLSLMNLDPILWFDLCATHAM